MANTGKAQPSGKKPRSGTKAMGLSGQSGRQSDASVTSGMDFFAKVIDIIPRLRTPLQVVGLCLAIVGVIIVRLVSPDNIQAMISAGFVGIGLMVFASISFVLPQLPGKHRAVVILSLFFLYVLTTVVLVWMTFSFISEKADQLKSAALSTVQTRLANKAEQLESSIAAANDKYQHIQRDIDRSQSQNEVDELTSQREEVSSHLAKDQRELEAVRQRIADLVGTQQIADSVISRLLELRAEFEQQSDDSNTGSSNVDMAITSATDGNFADAERLLRARLQKAEIAQQEISHGKSRDLLALGQIIELNGNLPEALNYYKQSAQAYAKDPIPFDYMGRLLRLLGNYQEAMAAFQTALSITRAPGYSGSLQEPWLLSGLAVAYWHAQRNSEAQITFQTAYGMTVKGTLARALVSQNWGAYYWDQDRFDEAETLLREADRIYELLPKEKQWLRYETSNNLGGILLAKGQMIEARKHLESANALQRASVGEVSLGYVQTRANLMLTYCRVDDSAGKAIAAEISGRLKEQAEFGYERINIEYAMSECLQEYGDLSAAAELLKAAMLRLDTQPGASDSVRAKVALRLASILLDEGHLDLAEELLTAKSELIDQGVVEGSRSGALRELVFGRRQLMKGNQQAAIEHFTKSTSILRQLVGDKHPSLVWPELYLAEARLKKTEAGATIDEAKANLQRAKAIIDQLFAPCGRAMKMAEDLAKAYGPIESRCMAGSAAI